jgi:hypothetical protein
MHKFGVRVLAFLAVAVASYALLFLVAMLLNRQAIDNCRLEQGVDSVILGDSHTAWAINDAGMAGVRNVSHNAEGYKYTYAKLRHLLDTEPGIRRVYLGFSYHNLSAYFDEYVVGPTFVQFMERYLGVMGPADYVELGRNGPGTVSAMVRKVLREGLPLGLRRKCLLYGRFSDEPMNGVFNLASAERRIADQYFQDGRLQGQSRLNLEYLERIVGLLRERDVELVLLNTPLHPEYARRVPAQFRELHDRFIGEHALAHYDFSGLELSDAEFLPDGDHTNFRGATLTSRRFAEYHAAHPIRGGN